MAQGNKARLNVTIDPDIYKESKRVFAAMDMNMSGFIEMQLALFLESVRPLTPLMIEAAHGERDPAEVKTAVRKFLSQTHKTLGGQLSELGVATGQLAALVDDDTDKK